MPKVSRAIVVQAPVDEVYQVWHNFENFPQFMDNLEEVEVFDGGRSHWRAKGPLGTAAEWDAEMTLDEPGRAIGWRSIASKSSVKTAGRVTFAHDPTADGTRIDVELEYESPGGAVGEIVTKIFANPDAQVDEDLRRFKEAIERGSQMSGFAYGRGGRGDGSGEHEATLGGSMGATTERDLEAIDASNSGIAPESVDDPGVRKAQGQRFGHGDKDLPRV
jgi:hypothetical protein